MMVIDTNIEGKFSLTVECLWINEEGMMELKKKSPFGNHHNGSWLRWESSKDAYVGWGGLVRNNVLV